MRRTLWTGLLFLLSACATIDDVKSPTVALAELSMVRTGLLSQEVVITLRVGNPNDFAIPLEGLALTVAVNDRELATGLSDETVTLPRLGYADVAVTATASTIGLIRELIALGTESELEYRIFGTAYVGTPVGRRAIPYEQKGDFSILPPSTPERRKPGWKNEPKVFKTI